MKKEHHLLLIVPAVALIALGCACTGGGKDTLTDDSETGGPVTEPLDSALVPQVVPVPAGSFTMGTAGAKGADYDEAPAHTVSLSAFNMGATEVTNIQFEAFRPEHAELRGNFSNKGFWFSTKDDEPVINVSWDDAVAYCEWLSARTGRSFRLPTEAEWEYACRAGTKTAYYTGASLPADMQKQQKNNRDLEYTSLIVGQTAPNAWGLYDMHGNVEEWCSDWYGPYAADARTNPGGPSEGIYKVTRGGSHNTPVEYLRSANRSAATPDDSSVLIGFRVVESDTTPETYAAAAAVPRNADSVKQDRYDWGSGTSEPFWLEPIPFVVEPSDGTPFYSHNHQPAITWCDNGDLLAVWYTCNAEAGREMEVVASRLRRGASEWEPASTFFKVPDRNMTGSSLLRRDDGTLIHMNGVSCAGEWQNLALSMRMSSDNGATWTAPVLVEPRHDKRHQVISGPIILKDGTIVQNCDAEAGGSGGTSIHLSHDGGVTWADPWDGKSSMFMDGGTGSSIAGIHAGIVQLADGSLLAFGRGNAINGKMPQSTSSDVGKTWTYGATPFPGIGSGQRHVLMRLQEGPIILASFGSNGLFVSLSDDEGKSWSEPKLMTDGKTRTLDGGAHTGTFTMDADHAEPKGYFAATQTPDGTIHLISSRLHYRFNLAWIRQ